MGHKGGGRHDGAAGDRRDRRNAESRELKRQKTISELAELAGRRTVRKAADGHSSRAVARIAELMESEDEYIAIAASREMLRLANAYPTKFEQNTGQLGAGTVSVVISAFNGQLPKTAGEFAKLPAQVPLTPAPGVNGQVVEAEFQVTEPSNG